MTETTPEALRLAEILEGDYCPDWFYEQGVDEVAAELRRLHAENTTLQQGYDAARLEIDGLHARVQELGAMLRENRSKRIVELEAQLEAIGAGGVEPLRSRRCLHQIAEPGVAPEHALKAMTLEQAAESMRAMQARPARIIAASGSCAPAAPQDTPEAIDGTIQVLKECGGFTEQAPVIRQLRRYATLLATLVAAQAHEAAARRVRKPLTRADYENKSEYLGCTSAVMRHGFESGVRFAERMHGIWE